MLAVLLVGAAGLGGLAGCRTAPSVAAYVGQTQVSVAELDDAVARRLADPDIAAFVGDGEAAFTRQVLSLQVTEAVHDAAAQRLDVEVTDADVRDRIGQLLDGSDPAAVFAQVARQQGASEADVVENVRQQLIRQRLAAAVGEADLSEAGLRARYEQVRESLGQVELGLVTVPDQAAADAVLARLTADPAAYPAVAAQYAGPNTLPQIEARPPADLPQVLAAEVARTAPGQGFTLAVPQAGGVVVGFVRAVVRPTFEEVRDELAEQALADADAVGQQLVSAVRDDLDVVVNPRYGELTEGQVVPADGGVVQLLADAGAAPAGD